MRSRMLAAGLLLLGFALSATVTNLKLGVVDDDQSIESRALVNALGESKSFRLTATYGSVNELAKAVTRGALIRYSLLLVGASAIEGMFLYLQRWIIIGASRRIENQTFH